MSEAIIVRGGIAAGGNVDLSWVNSSLSSINGKIDTVNSKLNTMNNRINNAVSSAGDAPTTGMYVFNIYYRCTKSGNYWVEVVGGGGHAGGTAANSGYGGGSGYINNGLIRLNKNDYIPIVIGEQGSRAGATCSFGTYLAAAGGSSGDRNEPGIGGNSGLDNRYDKFGGILYYSDSNHMRLSTTGSANSVRLYYGDGGSWDSMSPSGDSGFGKSGCVIIHYIN